MRETKIKIGITMGDPAGIGPEVVAGALGRVEGNAGVGFVIYGDATALKVAGWGTEAAARAEVIDFKNAAGVEMAKATAAGGRASLDYIEAAVRDASAGKIDAIVTAPVNKEAILAAGSEFSGHTEMLAALTGGDLPVMMLKGGPLKVALMTTHCALSAVPALITRDRILRILAILDDAMKRYFGVAAPRIAVCGLNPHAGETVNMGSEERDTIAPAVAEAAANGVGCVGPLPGDTVFHRAVEGEFDAVLAMYHDQGLAPLKTIAFREAVNVTLGLPIIRTSVGHGTAFEIAGMGQADCASMLLAIRTAVTMVRNGQLSHH